MLFTPGKKTNQGESEMSTSTMVPGVRKEEWAQATDKAKDAISSAGDMAGHAVSAVGEIASQKACEMGARVDQMVEQAGAGIHHMGDTLGRNLPHNGMLGAASQGLAGAVQHSGEYLEDQKLSGLSKDITCLIRRNPVPSVLIALGIGWLAARKIWK